MKFRIDAQTLASIAGAATPVFPKYTTQILNLANSNAQGTRPSVVGQMSDLIVAAEARTLDDWESWYTARHPQAVGAAADRVEAMVALLRVAIDKIDRPMIEAWVRDLVINKTFVGFRVQDAVLVQLAAKLGLKLRAATPAEESRGIDGYLGDLAVQVKPTTYATKRALPEVMAQPIVYYEKSSAGVTVDATEIVQAMAANR